jgi:hypothetical protein
MFSGLSFIVISAFYQFRRGSSPADHLDNFYSVSIGQLGGRVFGPSDDLAVDFAGQPAGDEVKLFHQLGQGQTVRDRPASPLTMIFMDAGEEC